ncbi:MAG: hypothetical protein HY821_04000 [Acidobacteria bacterium]|nr:hypothetical protein [Acidobacteriota bacterium]
MAPMPVLLGAAAALGVVLLLSLGLVARVFLRKRKAPAGAMTGGTQALSAGKGAAGQLPMPEQRGFEDKAREVLERNKAEQERLENETLLSLQLPPQTKKSEVLKKVISDQAKKDAAATAQLIRTWITEGR